MLAHHPSTGQPIRIIRTGLEIAANRKTLIWLRDGFKASHRWSRCLTVITEPGALPLCRGSPNAVVLSHISNIRDWLSVLPTIFSSGSETLLLAPNKVLTTLSNHGFHTDLAFSFEDLYDYYPYLGEPLHENDTCEKVILSLAHIFRISKLVWTGPQNRTEMPAECHAQYDAWIKACDYGKLESIPVDADDSVIPRTWLLQQYFRSANNRRANEILTCLEKNIACEYIDHILLLNEQEYSELPVSPKLTTRILPHRLTYYDVLKTITTSVPAGAYVIFSNADIWFNETLRHIWSIGLKEHSLFLALLRWEDNGDSAPTIYGPRADSQDTWIVARDSITFDITEKDFGFPFGKSGCDNAIALVMLSKRLLVSNPAYTIKTMHAHKSNIRNYDPKDILYRTHYLYVDPTAIQPIKTAQNLDDYIAPPQIRKLWSSYLTTSFARPVLGIRESDAKQFCDMLRFRGDTFIPHEQNIYTPPLFRAPLYHFEGGHFVTTEGLISSFSELVVGNHKKWKTGWGHAKHSLLQPSIHVPSIIAYPCDSVCGESLSKWVLYYLPHVLTIRNIIKHTGLALPEFLVPQNQDIGAFLNDCVWNENKTNITVVPMLADMNYYSESVWAVPPQDDVRITTEDIQMLRSLLPKPTEPQTSSPIIVFCVDDDEDAVCTRGWAEETAENIIPKGWIIRYVSQTDLPSVRRKAFQQAAWIVGSGASLDWMWYAPKGAHILEFICDDSNSDHIHLAGASSLHYVVAAVNTNEPIVFQRQNALLDVGKAIKLFGFKEMLDAVHNLFQDRPRVLLPSGKALEGIHSHTNSGFREIVEIWGERGYVNIVHTEDSPYCWWGGIGDVLLYDRESARWLHNVPSYQMALFGNCSPPNKDAQRMRQSVWSFWPYSPRIVEGVAARVENMLGYTSRSISSLFIGRVSNGIQKAARCTTDWYSAVELFSMPIDSSDAGYPFTQEEYLAKLCSARFGLSLPGSGQKCHREIEYFACGCVPIITEGVDMKQFLVPPIEGIHYFKASTPEDVKRIVNTTPPHKWAAMSAAGRNWWRSYASAEGLFRLTWARIEQCKPYYNVGIPQHFNLF